MRELDDALKALSEFESLIRKGLRPEKDLKRLRYGHRWNSFKFAYLEYRIGPLTVEVKAHASERPGHLNVWVWNFNAPAGENCKFDMWGSAPHVAGVVSDYINKYEATA